MERIRDAIDKARVERGESLSLTELHGLPQNLRQILYLAIVLIFICITAILFLFWYISDLKYNTASDNQAPLVVAPAMPQKTAKPSATNIEKQIALAVAAAPTNSNSSPTARQGDVVNIFYEGTQYRAKVIGKVSDIDADYIRALEQLQQGSASVVGRATESEARATQASVTNSVKSVDHFNKIIIEDNQVSQTTNGLTFADRVRQAVKDASPATTKAPDKDSYIASLNQASIERKNETRIIKIRRGDSLWRIAKRAYGTGYKYPLIFKANPHLTNPDRIAIGDFLRVPL